jgi:hypothetical protein
MAYGTRVVNKSQRLCLLESYSNEVASEGLAKGRQGIVRTMFSMRAQGGSDIQGGEETGISIGGKYPPRSNSFHWE